LFVLAHRFRQKTRIYASSSKVNSPAAPAVARKRQPWLQQDLCNNAILCDVVLIAAGVAGMGTLITEAPSILFWIKIAGAAFLFWYGVRAARSALNPAAMAAVDNNAAPNRKTVIAAMLAFSLLNPHVYLDTVVLLGSIGGQQSGNGRLYFAMGAMLASTIWFSSLGLGARYLTPIFSRPAAWRILDGIIALVMWTLAISLFF
jgi:L-lysine exporter family protein LysE/ArgO